MPVVCLDLDDHTKDIDFSAEGISARWEAGYDYARRAIDRQPWNAEGVALIGPSGSVPSGCWTWSGCCTSLCWAVMLSPLLIDGPQSSGAHFGPAVGSSSRTDGTRSENASRSRP